jgi:acyl dehydratase
MGLFLEDLRTGQTYRTASRTVTEADVVIYSGLSADYNSLHTDEEYAKGTPYGTRIAHGPLVLAMAMGLLNRLGLTEGTSLGFLAIDSWRFIGAVKIGDTITVEMTITDARASSKAGRGVLKRHLEVINQRGETVQQGDMVSLVQSRPEPGA